jgi:hypothetical protein
MNAEMTRRQFCGASLTLAVPPSLRVAISHTPGPDDEILAAVSAWMSLEPVLRDIARRRDDAWDLSFALMDGECPMGDYEANRAWHDAWDRTPFGLLQEEWERVAHISDGYMTLAVNTPAKTADGIAAKLRLYRASCEYFDDDPYQLERIQRDIDALSGGEA